MVEKVAEEVSQFVHCTRVPWRHWGEQSSPTGCRVLGVSPWNSHKALISHLWLGGQIRFLGSVFRVGCPRRWIPNGKKGENLVEVLPFTCWRACNPHQVIANGDLTGQRPALSLHFFSHQFPKDAWRSQALDTAGYPALSVATDSLCRRAEQEGK